MIISSEQNRSETVGRWTWLLPAAFLVHVAEEAFGGHGLMEWMVAGGGSSVFTGGISRAQYDRCRRIVYRCMGSPEVENLALAPCKRGDDLCRQRHLARCHMRDNAIVYSRRLDGAITLYSPGLHCYAPAAESSIAKVFCDCYSNRDGDPRNHDMARAADARF